MLNPPSADMAASHLLRVLLAEGLPLVRALLKDILAALPGVVVVSEVTAHADLVPCARQFAPDLVLLDWSLGGLDSMRALQALRPAPALIVMVPGGDSEYCAAVMAHGGAACLPREYLHRRVPGAVLQIMAEQR